MRLHALTVTAFGPFDGTVAVDLDSLASDGVFLLTGPTGAGKTSLLDAVTFALFGDVPGRRSKAKALPSDHADPRTRPEVVLDASLRGRRLRITRRPAWARPSRRTASGTALQHPTVLVHELVDDEWQVRATQIPEAARFLDPLLGMTLAQFCQVVLLPQGAFSTFLHAGADERRDVLERLFDAQLYADLEAWMAAHRTDLGRELDNHRREVDSVRAALAEVVGGADEPPPDDPEQLGTWVSCRQSALDDAATAATAELRVAEETAQLASQALEDGRSLDSRLGRYTDARARESGLATGAADRARWADELREARRAAAVLPWLAQESAADAEQNRRDAAAQHAREVLAALGCAAAGGSADDLARAVRDVQEEQVRLDAAAETLRQLGALRRERATAQEAVDDAALGRAALEAEQAALPERRRAIEGDLAAAETGATDAGPAGAAALAAEATLSACRQLDGLLPRLDVAATALATARDAERVAEERGAELRRRRITGMAAELAGDLQPGQACVVCGSADHPRPAAPPDAGAVTAADEQDAQEAASTARAARAAAEAASTRLTAQVDAVRAVVASTTTAQAEADLAAAERRLAQAREAAELAESLRAELPGLRAAETSLAEQVTDLRAAEAASAACRDQLDRQLAALAGTLTQAGLPATAAGPGDLVELTAGIAAETAAAARLLDALDKARRAVDAATLAASEAERLGGELDAACAAAGFGDRAAAAAAARDDDAVQGLDADVLAYDAEQRAVATLLADPDLQGVADVAAPQVDALLGRVTATAAARDQAHLELDRLDRTRQRTARLAAGAERAVAAWRPARDRHAVAHALAQALSGTSGEGLRMRLSAYVLAARLEQVVAAASGRLASTTGGRFTLVHTADREAGDRRAGLGLRVVDSWTGKQRDPATLSGGETFLASLALALGLADVVADEAGGVHTATLFIDEGFGSLDVDTLDEVLDVIDGLRAGGRVIGIVSHVEALADRIPSRVVVHKSLSGSSVSQVPSPATPAVPEAVA